MTGSLRTGHPLGATVLAQLYGDAKLFLSVPGMGPVTASVVRGFLADGTAFASGRQQPLRRIEPVDLLLGHGFSAQPSDHQGRPRGAPAGILQVANAPGGRIGGPPGSTTS
jgi:hypothetical protein